MSLNVADEDDNDDENEVAYQYDDETEAAYNLLDGKKGKLTPGKTKRWKNPKHILSDPYSCALNFPKRQSNDESDKQETAEFKTSQKLLNCTKVSTASKKQQSNATKKPAQTSDDNAPKKATKSQQQSNDSKNPDSFPDQKKNKKNQNLGENEELLTCKNGKGDKVDWFMCLLTPPGDYGYIDNKTKLDNETKMEFSQHIYSRGSPVYQTWQQYFSKKDLANTFILIYNDQHPAPRKIEKAYGAHQKGFIIFQGERGIFCTHSVPKFPYFTKKDFKESKKAQHFLAFNIDFKCLRILSNHLWRTHPMIRYINVPEEFKRIGKIGQISAGKFSNDEKDIKKYYETDVETVGGLKFKIISRTNTGIEDYEYSSSIWDHLLKKFRSKPFKVQTWRNKSKGCCNDEIKNTVFTKIRTPPPRPQARKKWPTNSDHTKIGFSKNCEFVCFSDLNHTRTEATRGGSLFLFTNKNLAKVFKNTFQYDLSRKKEVILKNNKYSPPKKNTTQKRR
uniref:Deoxyribonuclease II n=1 Tax=Panagrolaimus davidi TaxID=227884 RepID=A0A914QDN2_9BILA